jgi:hypothetical protein
MITEYKGRHVRITEVRKDGFPATKAEVNGEFVFVYPLRSVEDILEQTQRDIDAVDANPRAGYAAHWYVDGDPRKAARQAWTDGDRSLMDQNGNLRVRR